MTLYDVHNQFTVGIVISVTCTNIYFNFLLLLKADVIIIKNLIRIKITVQTFIFPLFKAVSFCVVYGRQAIILLRLTSRGRLRPALPTTKLRYHHRQPDVLSIVFEGRYAVDIYIQIRYCKSFISWYIIWKLSKF